MAPHPRVVAAFHAMEALGVSKSNVTPVLVNLLELYDKNWKPIEEDNYRFLADAKFDEVDSKVMKGKKKCKNFDEEESQLPCQPKRPLKRLRLGSDKDLISPSSNTCKPISGGTSLIRPKVEEDELLVYTHPFVGPKETDDMLAGDMPQYEPSIAADPSRKGYSLLSDDSTGKQNYQGPVASQEVGGRGSHILASSIERRMKFEFSTISEESPCDFKSASSSPLEEMVDSVERPTNDTVILLSDDSETDAPSDDNLLDDSDLFCSSILSFGSPFAIACNPLMNKNMIMALTTQILSCHSLLFWIQFHCAG